MNSPGQKIAGALILADDSAHWVVAGLRQLDRLALSLDEYSVAAKRQGPVPVCVLWRPAPPETAARLPHHPRLTHLSCTEDLGRFIAEMPADAAILVLDTHLVLQRGSLASALERSGPWLVARAAELPSMVAEKNLRPPLREEGAPWYYLHQAAEIPEGEKRLLGGTAKSQDGMISRHVNRPVSRALSRRLMRTRLRPNQLTVMLTALPLAGSLFLLRGGYLGFALGAVFFQLHSALDGCDGEIARVKYQDSAGGRKLDGLCDRFSTLLYAVALGLGLFRHPGVGEVMRWVYPLEGILAALLIGISETWLTRISLDEYAETSAGPANLYPQFVKEERHHFNEGDHLKLLAIKNSGLLFLGKGAASLFSELTKRDVFNFGFMLLALCGWPQWILHILAVSAGAIAIFAVKDLLSPALDPKRVL